MQPEQITPTEEKEIPNLEDMKNREAIHKIQCENGGRSGGTSNTQVCKEKQIFLDGIFFIILHSFS